MTISFSRPKQTINVLHVSNFATCFQGHKFYTVSPYAWIWIMLVLKAELVNVQQCISACPDKNFKHGNCWLQSSMPRIGTCVPLLLDPERFSFTVLSHLRDRTGSLKCVCLLCRTSKHIHGVGVSQSLVQHLCCELKSRMNLSIKLTVSCR